MAQDLNNIKYPILNFIKNLVTKQIYFGIKRLLNPCCVPTISNIEVECVSTGVYNVTATLSNSSFANGWTPQIFLAGVGNYEFSYVGEVVGNTLVFTDVYLVAAGDYSMGFNIYYAVNPTGNLGVIESILVDGNTTFPAC